MNFREYLLNESDDFLAQKVGDILTAVQELVDGGKQVGARQLVRNTEVVVAQIRKILHNSWPRAQQKHLRRLQKVGVALMKTIDEKGDLPEVLTSAQSELEKVSERIGKPVHHLGTPEEAESGQEKPEQSPQAPGLEGMGVTAQSNPNSPLQVQK
jgi:hypothetical protein